MQFYYHTIYVTITDINVCCRETISLLKALIKGTLLLPLLLFSGQYCLQSFTLAKAFSFKENILRWAVSQIIQFWSYLFSNFLIFCHSSTSISTYQLLLKHQYLLQCWTDVWASPIPFDDSAFLTRNLAIGYRNEEIWFPVWYLVYHSCPTWDQMKLQSDGN